MNDYIKVLLTSLLIAVNQGNQHNHNICCPKIFVSIRFIEDRIFPHCPYFSYRSNAALSPHKYAIKEILMPHIHGQRIFRPPNSRRFHLLSEADSYCLPTVCGLISTILYHRGFGSRPPAMMTCWSLLPEPLGVLL
jgi:hypothetical protein